MRYIWREWERGEREREREGAFLLIIFYKWPQKHSLAFLQHSRTHSHQLQETFLASTRPVLPHLTKRIERKKNFLKVLLWLEKYKLHGINSDSDNIQSQYDNFTNWPHKEIIKSIFWKFYYQVGKNYLLKITQKSKINFNNDNILSHGNSLLNLACNLKISLDKMLFQSSLWFIWLKCYFCHHGKVFEWLVYQ